MRQLLSGTRAVLAVVLLTLLALGLRVALLGQSFYGDELFTLEIATRDDLGAVLDGVQGNLEISPPLYFVVAWFFQHVGDPFVWLRVPSVLCGVATVPLVYWLGKRTVGREAGVLAAAVVALSPFAMVYATEARAYALMVMLVAASTLALLTAVRGGSRWWWVATAALAAAAMYAHYTCVFVLIVQFLWACFYYRAQLGWIIGAHAAAAVAYLPWIPSLRDDADSLNQIVINVLEPFGPDSLVRNLGRVVAGNPSVGLSRLPGVLPLALMVLAVGVAAAFAGRERLRERVVVSENAVLVGALAVAAPLGAALYSAVSDDIFIGRNLISSLPFIALAIGGIVTAAPRRVAVACSLVVVGAFAFSAVMALTDQNSRPDYRAAAEYAQAEAGPGGVLIELNPFPPPPGDALKVHLDPPYRLFTGRQSAAAVSAAGGNRVVFIRPELASIRRDLGPVLLRDYRVVEKKSWPGVVPLTALVLEPRN